MAFKGRVAKMGAVSDKGRTKDRQLTVLGMRQLVEL